LRTWEDEVRVLSRKRLRDFARTHASAAKPLDAWHRIAKAADWSTPLDVREQCSRAETVGEYTVFNIKGNEYRLVATIDYGRRIVYVRWLGTHAEYDKGKWKR
jgi:mRNA interferase HigB